MRIILREELTYTQQLLTPIHVMVDLETLGLKPGCKILSIGAVVFQSATFGRKFFDVPIDTYNQELMDAPDPDTVTWWGEQSDEARCAAFNSPHAKDLVEVLTCFNDWITSLRTQPDQRVCIWGNGATFDVPILEEACKRYGVPIAWTFRDSMCFRTLKELGKMIGIKEPEFVGVKHNALADAMHQAAWADIILEIFIDGQSCLNFDGGPK